MDFSKADWRLYLFLAYLLVNFLVFCLYAIDKRKARKGRWRIPEKTLLCGAVFGIFGAILGMLVCHHKTRKPKFYLGVPGIAFVEFGLIIVYFFRDKIF